ncbi:MAG: chemoreceptor glutamine deamidase CheD [Myxococcota bacterium]
MTSTAPSLATRGAPAPAPPTLRGFEGTQRYWDGVARVWTAHVLPGEFYVTREDEVLATVLGSCVSVCMRDPVLKIGGMNHFLLPGDGNARGDTTRYGIVALERLINELVKHGGQRERFETKLFGGGRVIGGSLDIGKSNIDFVHRYLHDEQLAVAAEDVGGNLARRVRYHPVSGKIRLLRMPMTKHLEVEDLARKRAQELEKKPATPNIELF